MAPPPPSSTTNTTVRSNHNHTISSSTAVAPAANHGGHSPPSMREAHLLSGDQREVKINDAVGNRISGILYKWVNYGRGWRLRWFVLQDGVLSYYKIHGPDKIIINQETEKGSKVIGQESLRRISLYGKNGTSQVLNRKPFGEIHLKVSSIRESKSDDKRFSIFTGTKRLHLRTETREDRVAWMDALQAVKEMFPRISNSELMAPPDNVTVSTERLRQRLQQEGVSEKAIQDSERIMRNEFASMKSQLVLLKQKHWLLIETLQQLEASATESDDDNEKVDAAEEETDDKDNAFFDTRDFLSSSSFKSNGSDIRRSSFGSDVEDISSIDYEDGLDPIISNKRIRLL
ncbi:hypothetical protein RJ641_031964 [Dillenia turbinata]|uniref:PH domain-containing protein n=1 Tax=Dillenia turbinata TaxID=194707 RepID=A0AAN8VZ46_9MAGN